MEEVAKTPVLMNKEEFIDMLQHPAKLDSTTLVGLRTLSFEFPYCSSIRIMLSINQYKEKDVRYETDLRTTAIYAGDRAILKKHIDRVGMSNVRIILPDEEASFSSSSSEPVTTKQEDVSPAVDELVSTQKENTISVETESEVQSSVQQKVDPVVDTQENTPVVEEISDQEDNFDLSIKELKDIVNRHIQELEQEHQEVADPKEKPVVKSVEIESPGKTKSEILDNFIKNQPSISRPKASFYNPVEVAKESIVDQESIVSETLATIYYDQGHLLKAVKIYQKLSLKYPEKSSYFAALIKKAEKELNT